MFVCTYIHTYISPWLGSQPNLTFLDRATQQTTKTRFLLQGKESKGRHDNYPYVQFHGGARARLFLRHPDCWGVEVVVVVAGGGLELSSRPITVSSEPEPMLPSSGQRFKWTPSRLPQRTSPQFARFVRQVNHNF